MAIVELSLWGRVIDGTSLTIECEVKKANIKKSLNFFFLESFEYEECLRIARQSGGQSLGRLAGGICQTKR